MNISMHDIFVIDNYGQHILNFIVIVCNDNIPYVCMNHNISVRYIIMKRIVNDDLIVLKTEHRKSLFIDDNYKPNFSITYKEFKNTSFILPHAGSKYVKNIMDTLFNELAIKNLKNIILISASHDLSMGNYQFNTNKILIGNKYIDNKCIDIKKINGIQENDFKMLNEHSYLSVLPYICKILEHIDINLYIVCVSNHGAIKQEQFADLFADKTLLICNTDLSHVTIKEKKDLDNVIANDNETINLILKGKTNNNMCGGNAVELFFKLHSYNMHVNKLYYKNVVEHMYSSSINIENGDYYVGYFGAKFIPINTLLNNIYYGNDAVVSNNKNKYYYDGLNIEGLFITIYDNNNNTRGCIGNFHIDNIENAIAELSHSALNDYKRFTNDDKWIDNIKKNNFKKSITLLGNMVKQKYDNIYNHFINKFVLGKNGIVFEYDNKKSTYLANVVVDIIINFVYEKTGIYQNHDTFVNNFNNSNQNVNKIFNSYCPYTYLGNVISDVDIINSLLVSLYEKAFQQKCNDIKFINASIIYFYECILLK